MVSCFAALLASCEAEPASQPSAEDVTTEAVDNGEDGALTHPYGLDVGVGLIEEIDETRGGWHDGVGPSLCDMAYCFDGGAGVFEVVRLTSVYEYELGGDPADGHSYTYIELSLIEDWSGFAANEVVVRTPGGRHPDGSGTGWNLSVHRGEIAAMFLLGADPSNAGFAYTEIYAIWPSADGGQTFESETFFDTPRDGDDLGPLVRSVYDALPRVDQTLPLCDAPMPRELCPAGTGLDWP